MDNFLFCRLEKEWEKEGAERKIIYKQISLKWKRSLTC